ncbi:MAG: hypothetical protein U0638_10065 [Phycisphaerales bacterium]
MKKIFAMLAAVSAMSLAACSVNSNKGECKDGAECKDKAACADKACPDCKDGKMCDACKAKAAAKQGGGAAPVNTKCPVSGEPIKAGGPTVSFNGQTVGLCCPGCTGKFNAMSDADKAAAVTKAK